MKVGFTGTKRGMSANQRIGLMMQLASLKPTLFIHGGCIGADDQADEIACSLGIPRVVYPSDRVDKRVHDEVLQARSVNGPRVYIHPPDDPLKRNRRIVFACHKLIACPGQAQEIVRSGTWTTVRIARRELGEHNVEIIRP